ncbi:hypothetical protein PUN28_014286 [Cardiocondyla obscurior]|uniref:Transmembrane protein n=1 Tax=Cardiocondyla obscurior TaxID=286306 RepID=A0AAW2F3K7_9HYME
MYKKIKMQTNNRLFQTVQKNSECTARFFGHLERESIPRVHARAVGRGSGGFRHIPINLSRPCVSRVIRGVPNLMFLFFLSFIFLPQCRNDGLTSMRLKLKSTRFFYYVLFLLLSQSAALHF